MRFCEKSWIFGSLTQRFDSSGSSSSVQKQEWNSLINRESSRDGGEHPQCGRTLILSDFWVRKNAFRGHFHEFMQFATQFRLEEEHNNQLRGCRSFSTSLLPREQWLTVHRGPQVRFASKNQLSSRFSRSFVLRRGKTPTCFYGESACNDGRSRKTCFRQIFQRSRSGMEVEFSTWTSKYQFGCNSGFARLQG